MSKGVYYNEIDPFAAEWLKHLITAGAIASGDVDTRSIEDVAPADLCNYTQHHFFAGIGGWSYALRLVGWPDDRPVWTGSCPCQPFSQSGKKGGFDDERHLWPAFYWLIEQCGPAVVFGEQVASPDGLAWLDLVSADLEGSGYAVGAADLCAAGVGAPHIRQRLYWLGVADSTGRLARGIAATPARQGNSIIPTGSGSGLADAYESRSQRRGERRDGRREFTTWKGGMVDCRDGKRRPIESGSFPLAHGVPGRVGLLRGYGNAIVPEVAATFIEASGLLDA